MSFLLRPPLQRISHIASRRVTPSIYNNVRLLSTPKGKKTKIKVKKLKSIETQSESLQIAETAAATTSSSKWGSSDWWRMKRYKFRRMLMLIGIPFAISTGLFALHDSDIPYVYCLKKLAKYPLPDDYDRDADADADADGDANKNGLNPAPSWAQTLPMLWAAQIHSHRPTRIMAQWKHFMPLLDKKYPSQTRMVAVGCLIGMLSGDTNTLPPDVFFDKCLRKLEILKGYKGSAEDGGWTVSKFLNMIYSLCGETKDQQLLFAGLQLLLDLTAIPNLEVAKEGSHSVALVMRHCEDVPTMRPDLAASLLVIYQDPAYIIDFVHKNPPRERQSSISPDFMEIKKILIDNDCMKFAFNLLDARSVQLKQLAMFILIGLVGNYPDIAEIKRKLGDSDDEKLQNGIKLVDSLAGIGQEHFQRGDTEAAYGAFCEALKYLPRSAQLRYLAGKCLGELGRVGEAKQEFRMAMAQTLKQSGNKMYMPEATMQLCNLLIKHGANNPEELEEAVEYLEMLLGDGDGSGAYQMFQTVESIEIDSIYDRLNVCLEALGRYDEALDRMLNLCKIKGNSHQIHFETGRMAILCKEYDLAREHLEFAVNLEPFDMFAKYHLAISYFYLDAYEKSKFELLQILESKPADEKCLTLLAKVHVQQQNFVDALDIYKTFEKESEKKKENAYLQYQIGVVYENLNENEESLKYFTNTAKVWLKHIQMIGYEEYFYNQKRLKEMKALQKIQSRCQHHRNDTEWTELNNIIHNIGLA